MVKFVILKHLEAYIVYNLLAALLHIKNQMFLIDDVISMKKMKRTYRN